MAAYEKITAGQALRDLQHGALLVDGYDDVERWEMTRVTDATSYRDFMDQADSLPRDAEIMFYCA
jgi:hypothetical protein